MKTVLLLVDQKARDLASVLLIGEYLKAMRVRTAICNKTNVLSAVLRHRPDVFVMSGTHGNFQAVARHIGPWCKLVLMTQEGACVTRDATILRHTLNGLSVSCYLAGLSRVYLWGETSRRWLSEAGVYPDEVMRVVGTSRLDVYRAAMWRARGSNESRPRDGLRIGVANRGATVNPVSTANPVELLDHYRLEEGSHRAYIDTGREWEDWVWHSVASLRVNLNVIERLCANPNYDVVFRPDPFEKVESYRFLSDRYKNFRINSDPILHNFVNEIDVLVTELSTTGIEAFILKRPVLSTQKLLGPRLADHNSKPHHFNPEHVRLYWQPASEAELLEYVAKAAAGELPYSPDVGGAQRYLVDFYDWSDRGVSASYRIANDLKQLAEAPRPSSMRARGLAEHETHPTVKKLMARLNASENTAERLLARSWLFNGRAILRAARQGSLNDHFRMEFYPWNVREARRVRAFFPALRAADQAAIAAAPGSRRPLEKLASAIR